MAKTASWDRSQWFTTTEMLDRGWARRWLEALLGQPTKAGANKLWPRDLVLERERHPVFAEARARLDDMAKGARYVTAEHEDAALQLANHRFDMGRLPTPQKIEIGLLADSAPSDFPKAEQTADALTLTWACGGKVVVPVPFLEALRQGLGETTERLSLAINTVLTDWRCAHVRPEKFQWGRNYFLGAVRNTIRKLQELEGPAQVPAAAEGEEEPFAPPQRVLH